jgi:hypothetical protein
MDADSNLSAPRNPLADYISLSLKFLYTYKTKGQKAYTKYTTLAPPCSARYRER